MTLPVTPLTWIGSALPIIVLLYLLVAREWPAVRASLIAALCALGVAVALYGAPAELVLFESLKGVWNSLSIIAVVIPAILIYEVSHETGGFAAIQRDLARLVPDRLLQVLLLGWCFSSFLQGPSGFGVPIAVTAPLLIGIGVRPFFAVLIPLMGHAWANTFGTLALAWEALVQQTALQSDSVMFQQTALWTGLLTGMLCLMAGLAICWQYGRWNGLRHGLPAVAILGSLMAGGQLVLGQYVPALCAAIPATIALCAAFALAKLQRYARADFVQSPLFVMKDTSAAYSRLNLCEALMPYIILVGISTCVLLTPPVREFLGSWKTSFAFPATSTTYGFTNTASAAYSPVAWLTHSGCFLLAAALFSWFYFYKRGLLSCNGTSAILSNTMRKAMPASFSVVLLLVMSKLMSGSGQVDVLAAGTAAATGAFYAMLAPAIGTLGAFMSSSNVSSNILFGSFQESVARLIDKAPALILAAQTSGAAVGTMFSPSKVLLGTTTAGIVGQEGAVIRKLLGVAVMAAAAMGMVVLLAA